MNNKIQGIKEATILRRVGSNFYVFSNCCNLFLRFDSSAVQMVDFRIVDGSRTPLSREKIGILLLPLLFLKKKKKQLIQLAIYHHMLRNM